MSEFEQTLKAEKPIFSQIINGDIRDAKSGFALQGTNAQGKMGSGLAKSIMDKWPHVKSYYTNWFLSGPENFLKLGDFQVLDSVALDNTGGDSIKSLERNKLYIVNIVSQEFYGYKGELLVSYPAIEIALTNIVRIINQCNLEKTIHTPKIGCGLAGGDWEVVKDIFKRVVPNDFELIFWDYAA